MTDYQVNLHKLQQRHAQGNRNICGHIWGGEPNTRTTRDMTNARRREATGSGATAVQASHKADTCTRKLTSSATVSPRAMTCACQALLEPFFLLQCGVRPTAGCDNSEVPQSVSIHRPGPSFRGRGWRKTSGLVRDPCREGKCREVKPALRRHQVLHIRPLSKRVPRQRRRNASCAESRACSASKPATAALEGLPNQHNTRAHAARNSVHVDRRRGCRGSKFAFCIEDGIPEALAVLVPRHGGPIFRSCRMMRTRRASSIDG